MTEQAVTLGGIRSVDWSLALDSPGSPGSGIGRVVQGTADVEQCLQIILTTPQGTDPLRPTFGTDLWQFLDYPVNAATPAIVQQVTAAIELWEPRVTLAGVSVAPVDESDSEAWAHLTIVLQWKLKLGGRVAQTNPLAQLQSTSIGIDARSTPG